MEISAVGAIVAIPAGAICMAVPLCRAICQLADRKPAEIHVWRWWLSYTVTLVLVVTAVAAGGLGLDFWMELPASQGIQLASTCKVLSKDVGLQTAKLCTSRPVSPLVNEAPPAGTPRGAPPAVLPSELRCYFEYYWACILEVEFWPAAALLPVHAAAQAPPSLLPAHCRPNFRAVWRTKDRFKINSSYPCRYSPTNLQKVHMALEVPRNCTAEEVTPGMLWRRYWLELTDSDRSIFSPSTENGQLYWGVVTGITQGVSFAVVCHLATMLVYSHMGQDPAKWDLNRMLFQVQTQGLILLVWSTITMIVVGLQLEYIVAPNWDELIPWIGAMVCRRIGCDEIIEAMRTDL